MTSQSPELVAILKRLERLEAESRESRFWGRWGPLIYLVIGAAIPFGLGVDGISRSMGQAEVAPRVEAQEFVLRDSGGAVRAKLVMGESSPRLTLYDSEGNPRESLSAERAVYGRTRGIRRAEGAASRAASAANSGLAGSPAPVTAPSTTPAIPEKVQPVTAPVAPAGLAARGAQASTLEPVAAALFAQAGQTNPAPLAGFPRSRPVARSTTASAGSAGIPAAGSPAPSSDLPESNPAGYPGVPTPAAAVPPAKLTVLGYVEKPGVGRAVAISDGLEVYMTHQGEMFAERFMVLKTTPTLVEIFDTYTNQTLELGFSP
ncbi:MAG TPA: hypothetical protein VKU44_01450 [Terriglobia bacterium]|nr:hypothetical protein [Terriglobia bacterium]